MSYVLVDIIYLRNYERITLKESVYLPSNNVIITKGTMRGDLFMFI